MKFVHEATIDATDDSGNPLLHIFRRYGIPYWPHFAVSMVARTLQQVVGRVPELVVGVAFDAVFLGGRVYELPFVPQAWIPETQMAQFWFTIAVLAGAYLATIPLQIVSSLTSGWFNKRLLHNLRTDTYDVMQRLSLGYFDDEESGEIVSILNNDVANVESFTGGTLASIIQFPLSVAIAFGFMALLNWQLAVVLLFAPVLIGILSFWYQRRIEPVYEDLRSRIGSLNTQFENNLSGIATIKAYTAEEQEVKRVRDVATDRLETELDQQKYNAAMAPLAGEVKDLAILTVVLLGGYWILDGPPAFFSGTMTVGTLFTFIAYTRNFVHPLRNIPEILDNYEASKASANRILPLHTDSNVIPETENAVEVSDLEGCVVYDDVSFAYGDESWTIRDVSFTVDPGEMIGIVGQTGAGKSTLLKLLFRFFDVDAGTISVDGVDIREMTRRSLRSQLGYVQQEPFLFYGTVRENITYGSDDASDDEIVEAARSAGAHGFITDLPDGYDTEVGERGVKLSGGQRQRIAIARTVIADPAVLILDEATSHVDNETEAVIQRNLEGLIADRTTFVIAHRLSTVRNADRILVIDDGQIVESGTHDELIDQDGVYSNLWSVQVGDVSSLSEAFVDRTERLRLEGDR